MWSGFGFWVGECGVGLGGLFFFGSFVGGLVRCSCELVVPSNEFCGDNLLWRGVVLLFWVVFLRSLVGLLIEVRWFQGF